MHARARWQGSPLEGPVSVESLVEGLGAGLVEGLVEGSVEGLVSVSNPEYTRACNGHTHKLMRFMYGYSQIRYDYQAMEGHAHVAPSRPGKLDAPCFCTMALSEIVFPLANREGFLCNFIA